MQRLWVPESVKKSVDSMTSVPFLPNGFDTTSGRLSATTLNVDFSSDINFS
jgi:hypothetical protein